MKIQNDQKEKLVHGQKDISKRLAKFPKKINNENLNIESNDKDSEKYVDSSRYQGSKLLTLSSAYYPKELESRNSMVIEKKE